MQHRQSDTDRSITVCYLNIKNETLHNVSTDGKRMAHITTPVGTYGNMSFVITLPAAKELCRIESENPLLRIVVDNTNMRLLLDYSEFIVVCQYI